MSAVSKLTLHQRLIQFHEEVTAVRKTATNPHYRSSYVDINGILSVVMPILTRLGIVVSQIPEVTTNGGMILATRIINADDKEDFIEGKVPMVVKDQSNPQQLGSAFSYFRRYSLVSMLQLEATDDDGNYATNSNTQQDYRR